MAACSKSATQSQNSASAPSPTKKWDFTLGQLNAPRDGNYADQIPAIGDDGTIYVGGALGLYAIRPDGTEKWHHDAAGQSPDVPVRFVLIDDTGNIWFDTTTLDTGAAIRVGPDGKGGEIGAIARVTQLGSPYDGTVFMATSASVLQMSTTQNADVLWRGYASGMAFLPDGGIVFTRQVDILSRADKAHSVKWNKKIGEGGCGSPVVSTDGTIYLPRNGGMDAYTLDGNRKWTFDLSARATSPSLGDDGTLYFGSDDNHLYSVSPGGQLNWKFAAEGPVRSVPAITANGEIIFGSSDHNLYAVDSLGKLKWRFAAGGQVFSPTMGADGTIYFQSADGKLYAIQDLAENGGLYGQWPKYNGGMRNTARAIK